MRRIFSAFCFLLLNIGTAGADAPCPPPQHLVGALKEVGRTIPSLLKGHRLAVENIYIPDNVKLEADSFADPQGNHICAYHIAGGAAEIPLFIVRMEQERPLEGINRERR